MSIGIVLALVAAIGYGAADFVGGLSARRVSPWSVALVGQVAGALAMLGLGFASVPLYRIFCQLTGFDGTPLRAEKAPGAVAGEIGVRFDANIQPGLPWRFEPAQKVRIAPGAQTQVFYRATNLTARPLTGQAVFNVTPDQAGKYFNKIECFCFTEQTLAPGQSVKMPILFFIDPAIL